MKHLNDNQLVAIDIQSSGAQPRFHDLIEIAAVALYPDLSINKQVMPLHLRIRPIYRNFNPRYTTLNNFRESLTFPDVYDAARLWEKWYEMLIPNHRKRIIPVVSHWHRKQPFLLDWLLHDEHGDPFYYHFFHQNQVRDIAVITAYLNDLGHFNDEYFPFPKDYLRNYARRLGLHWPSPDNALNRAVVIAQIYERLAKASIKAGLGLPMQFPEDEYHSPDREIDDSDDD